MKGKVIELYDYIGVSPKYLGYKYLVDETVLYANDVINNREEYLGEISKYVADKYNTNIMCVDRNTRTVIEGTFNKGNLIHINDIFQSVSTYYEDRPSIKLFLSTVVNYLINKK
ncbi:MAG: hypothetical protein IKP76_02155 [Bacilli bacterium]|nr:hypothetical protein [Bacilli bacterium]